MVSRYWLATASLFFSASRYIWKRYFVTAISSSACYRYFRSTGSSLLLRNLVTEMSSAA